MKKIFLSLLVVLFFQACKIQELQVTGVEGFKINSVNTTGIDGDILLKIKNPNSFGFKILRSEFDVIYSGIALGKAILSKKVKIKPNTEETYAFNLKGDLSNMNIMDVAKLLRGATFKNTMEIKGNLKAGKLFIRKSLPVDLKESLNLK